MRILLPLILFLFYVKGEQISDVPTTPYGFWPLVTPLLGLESGLSESCFNASMVYVDGLQRSETWALKMLDSSGPLPFLQEGFLADILQIPVGDQLCSLLEDALDGELCPDQIRNFHLNIPFSSNAGLGNQEECLSVTEIPTQYCNHDIVIVGQVGTESTIQKEHFNLVAPEAERWIALWKQGAPATQNESSIVEPQVHDTAQQNLQLPVSNIPVEILTRRNPAAMKTITAASEDIHTILKSSCPNCRQDYEILLGKLVMLYSLVWFTVNDREWLQTQYRTCYPAACSKWDIFINSAQLGKMYGLSFGGELTFLRSALPSREETISDWGFDPQLGCTSDPRYSQQWETKNSVAVIVFGILAILAVAGTVYDVTKRMGDRKQDTKDDKPKPNAFLMAFSLLANSEYIFSSKNSGSDRLGCLEGVRALSMTWVVLGHSFYFSPSFLHIQNKEYIGEIYIGKVGMAFRAITGGPFSVDTFFFIGATLVSYLILKDLDKTNGWANFKGFSHMVFLYINRVLRISIPYGLYILYVIGIPELIIYGPSYSMDAHYHVESSSIFCIHEWWKNLLYINNFSGEGGGQCVGQGWYLGTEMWLFFFSPVIIYPLWLSKFGRRYKTLALLWWLLLAVLALIFALRCAFNLEFLYGEGVAKDIKIEASRKCWIHVITPDFSPWGRRSHCYIVGLLLGYVLHITKGKKIQIPFILNFAIWSLVSLVFFSVIYAGYHTHLEDRIDTIGSQLWWSTTHFMWAGCLFWLIFACCRGLGGFINNLLSWGGWAPIAKISFMTYLVHMDIQFTFFRMQASFGIIIQNCAINFSGVFCRLDNATERAYVLWQPCGGPAFWLHHLNRMGTTPRQTSEAGHGCPGCSDV